MLTFERGEQQRAKGHALLYYKDTKDPSKVVATYLVVLPVSVDIVKYMPPFLASQAAELAGKGLSAFAFPPVPEAAESVERLVQLAESRDDDLLFGGTLNLSQVPYVLSVVNDAVQQYGEAYHGYITSLPAPKTSSVAEPTSFSIDDFLSEFMGDRDRLAEITKIIGTLRFALDGADRQLAKEAVGQVKALANRLPERYRAEELVQAAQDTSSTGVALARLYLDRCYKLLDDNDQAVKELDDQIRILRMSK